VRRLIVLSLAEEDYARLATEALFAALIQLEREGAAPEYDILSQRLEGEFEQKLLPGLLMTDLSWAGSDDFDTLFKKATCALESLRQRRLGRELTTGQIDVGKGEKDLKQKPAASMTPDEWEMFQQSMFRLYQEKAEIKRRMLRIPVNEKAR
jgi:hypothetical protein